MAAEVDEQAAVGEVGVAVVGPVLGEGGLADPGAAGDHGDGAGAGGGPVERGQFVLPAGEAAGAAGEGPGGGSRRAGGGRWGGRRCGGRDGGRGCGGLRVGDERQAADGRHPGRRDAVGPGHGGGAQQAVVGVDEFGAGVDAEFVGQGAAGAVEPVQCLRAPPGAAERQHECGDQGFAQRVHGGFGGQHAGCRAVVAESAVGAGEFLDGRESQFLQCVGGALQRHAGGGAGEGGAAPQGECLAQGLDRLGGVGQGAGGAHQVCEAVGVHREFGDAQQVGAAVGDEFDADGGGVVLGEQRAQARHVVVDDGARVPGRFLVPQRLGEPVHGDGCAGVEQQHGQQAAAFGGADG